MIDNDDINLRHLRVFSVIMTERSLTRTADVLDTSQSAISKVLARLRTHFQDQLFVRSGLTMEPTPKALEIMEPLRSLLAASDAILTSTQTFEPASSSREFRLLMTDVGMIHFLPVLMERFAAEGPNLRLYALPLDSRQLELKLESGEADLAIGDFPNASPRMFRQSLYSDTCLSAVRSDHPRLSALRRRDAFFNERHILVTSSTAGHGAHQLIEKELQAQLTQDRIQLRLPSFVAGAAVAKRTDAIITMPANLARFVALEFGLVTFPPPIDTGKIDIAQLWHERVQNDPGHKWLRALVFSFFHGKRVGIDPLCATEMGVS
jgi:DNA-binding transcriptional LysR family regulator